MSYVNVNKVLPKEVIKLIQQYIDGEYIYIPRKKTRRKAWGENTGIKQEMKKRNLQIYQKHLLGDNVEELALEFYLSKKSIQRIILQESRKQQK